MKELENAVVESLTCAGFATLVLSLKMVHDLFDKDLV